MKFIKDPLNQFIRLETSASIILFLSTVLALILANSALSDTYQNFWKNEITISIPGFELSKPILKWINDGLMAIFFFLIGLEIKREVLTGELSHVKKASLPVFAAIGGMLVPAVLFTLLNHGKTGSEGWGIPMAADIAFTLGILKLLGNKVPSGLKVFLMAFAIIDDLGAVLVIAFFYSTNLVWTYIGAGLAIVAALLLLSYRGYYTKYLFFLAGIVVWVLFLKSGIHATIAGVLLAMTIPLRRDTNTRAFYNEGEKSLDSFLEECTSQPENTTLTKKQLEALDELVELTEKTAPPLQFIEHRLHGWVSYLIMPLFAFANAGVVFNFAENIHTALSVNLAISLFIGNGVGIFLASWLAIRTKVALLPEGVNLKQLAGVSILGGLGFTMSLFINNLAYTDPSVIDAAKLGILIGSFIAGLVGYTVLRITLSGNSNLEDNS